MKLKVILTISDEGGFIARVPALGGCKYESDPDEEVDQVLEKITLAAKEFLNPPVDPNPPGGFVHEIEV